MNYRELSKYEKERFNNAICPVCGKLVFTADPFVMIKVKNSRSIVYNFIHESCLQAAHRRKKAADDFMPIPVDFDDSEGKFSASLTPMPAGIHSDNIDATFVG